jgi:hypothetical protein
VIIYGKSDTDRIYAKLGISSNKKHKITIKTDPKEYAINMKFWEELA